ncbi:MAG: NTP transferase domain-containing protein [Microbacterium sp.]|uniref:molybdenum cofactor guanylyltransferase n=1 Tax=Microbacterium sp. TaxID=51671 RepID=UPI0039E52A66
MLTTPGPNTPDMPDEDLPGGAMTLGAILLAGGRATRVGGADKALFEVGGRTLIERAVTAVTDAGATGIVAVGPARDADLPGVRWVREDPPFTGPAAAIVAALDAAAASEWTLVLACDLARPDAAAARLVADLPLLPADADGVCLADSTSRPQWLTGAYRTAALRRAAAALPDAARQASVRALLDDLAIAVVRVPDPVVADVDTWEDLEQARAAHRRSEGEET